MTSGRTGSSPGIKGIDEGVPVCAQIGSAPARLHAQLHTQPVSPLATDPSLAMQTSASTTRKHPRQAALPNAYLVRSKSMSHLAQARTQSKRSPHPGRSLGWPPGLRKNLQTMVSARQRPGSSHTIDEGPASHRCDQAATCRAPVIVVSAGFGAAAWATPARIDQMTGVAMA